MSLHHLDPRRAGTGAEPDVLTALDRNGKWIAHIRRGDNDFSQWHGGHDTETAALHAARVAAGFGHVAERACATFIYELCGTYRCSEANLCPGHECFECAWPRDAHGR